MYLVVGLGNPGRDYAETRHNAGFMAVEAVSRELGIPFNTLECSSLVGRGKYAVFDIVIAKPQTYMNRSGRAVKCLVEKYSIDVDKIILIYDDLDLPLGKIRIRPEGGSGGHKGVESVIRELGTDEFGRIRIGIGRPPAGNVDVVEYVLSPFSNDEKELMEDTFRTSVEALKVIIKDGYQQAMSMFNG
jgi:PTH1 family peptidyl-tRNA hydrolase